MFHLESHSDPEFMLPTTPAPVSGRDETETAPQANSRRFSLFSDCRRRKPERQTTLAAFIRGIRDGHWQAEVEECRRILKEKGQEAYKQRRGMSLPAVMLSASVKTKMKGLSPEAKGAVHSGLLQLDFDGKDHPDMPLAEIRRIVEAAPFVAACFDSLSGDGVKGIARCPASFDIHAGTWHAADAYFTERGLKLDGATKDPLRLCFVSYDRQAFARNDAVELVPVEVPEKGHDGEHSNGTEDPEHVERVLAELARKIGPYQKRETWLHIVGATVDAVGADEAGEIVDRHFPPANECDQSACDVAKGMTGTWLSLRKLGVDPADYVKCMPVLEDAEPEEGRTRPARKRLTDYRVNHTDTLGMTAAEIDALRPPYIIDGILRWAEVVLLGAESKSRKSWLAQDAAFAVASGTSWLADKDGKNGFATRQARVHVLDLELNKGEVRYRFAKARAGRFRDRLDDATEMTGMIDSYSLDGVNVKEILRLLEELKPAVRPGDLVIVDCLYRLCPDGNEVERLAEILEIVRRFASETRAGVIVVDHFRKAAADKSRDRFAGSFVKQASPSTLVGIEVTADDVLILDVYARTFFGCPKVHARFNPETYVFDRLPEREVQQAKAERSKAEAECWLRELWDGRATDSAIVTADGAQRWDIKRQAATPRLERLAALGFLLKKQAKPGQATEWTLAPAGKSVVQGDCYFGDFEL